MKCFFPVENFHFGRPKTNFSGFEKWKGKRKKKKKRKEKKRSSPHFLTFPPSILNFPSSLLKFSFFYSRFSTLFHFFLASFFPVGQQKFPGQKSLGGTLPPAPCLLRHWEYQRKSRVRGELNVFVAHFHGTSSSTLMSFIFSPNEQSTKWHQTENHNSTTECRKSTFFERDYCYATRRSRWRA